jgi:hypothetical protein
VGADTGSGNDPANPEPTLGPVPTAPRTDRAGEAIPTFGPSTGGPGPWGTIAWVAGGVVLAAVVVAAPAGARTWQRRRRLADGRPGALWDELTATALDVGVRPDPSWTPRQAARELTGLATRPHAGRAAAGVGDAIVRLARAEEAASYGPAARAVAGDELADDLRAARRGLLASASRRARLRALLWPASLLASVRTAVEDLAQRRPTVLGGRRRITSA